MKALMGNKSILFAGSFLLLCLGYIGFGYYLDRSQTNLLLLSYTGLWLLSWPWLRIERSERSGLNHSPFSWGKVLIAGLILRVLLLFSWPNLSQDVYRFLWDGALFAQGISPYHFTPVSLINQLEVLSLNIPDAAQLFKKMGALSAGNYSNYPPVKQLIFALPHWLGIEPLLHRISALRLFIILADTGVFFLGRQLLKKQSLNPNYIKWYFLNPLIILELTGNCHFEGFMALSILASIVLALNHRYFLSGILLAIGVGVKLIPLMFIPIILAHFASQTKQSQSLNSIIKYGLGLALGLALIFLPFLNAETLGHYWDTTGLWFTKFEFNASVYYVLRWIGFQWKGYNLIAQIGPALSLITTTSILYLSYRVWLNKSHLYQAMFWSILIYLVFATTVHPWYWTTVLILSILAQSRIGLVGSMLIFLSYTAYESSIVAEKSLWISIEYLLLIAYVLWELKNPTHDKSQFAKTSSS